MGLLLGLPRHTLALDIKLKNFKQGNCKAREGQEARNSLQVLALSLKNRWVEAWHGVLGSVHYLI